MRRTGPWCGSRRRNPVRALDDYDLPRPEFLQVPNRDGFEMEALLIKPPDFDPTQPLSPSTSTFTEAPTSSAVRNAWSAETLYWQLLAQHGVLVWVLDKQHRERQGAPSRPGRVYQRFGELELRDLEDGLDWLAAQPYVDAERIGIEGWSYGGFMVSYALTHSRRWSMGIAGGLGDGLARLRHDLHRALHADLPQNKRRGLPPELPPASGPPTSTAPCCSCTGRWTRTSTCRTPCSSPTPCSRPASRST